MPTGPAARRTPPVDGWRRPGNYPDRVATSPRLTIAHVTPYAWGPRDEANEFVAGVSTQLADRGHRVVVVAPGGTGSAIHASRAALRRARDDGYALFDQGWDGARVGDSGPAVVAVGQSIRMPRGSRPRSAPLPLDLGGTMEQMLNAISFDIVHVHDPFAPSASSAALRHSRSLNVGSFHEPTERILSTQVARPLVESFLGRLDARTVVGSATEELMTRFFPGAYEEVRGGADPVEPSWPFESSPAGSGGERPLRIAYCAREERGGLRILLRALRKLPLERPWEAAVWIGDATMPTPRINRELARRVRFLLSLIHI